MSQVLMFAEKLACGGALFGSGAVLQPFWQENVDLKTAANDQHSWTSATFRLFIHAAVSDGAGGHGGSVLVGGIIGWMWAWKEGALCQLFHAASVRPQFGTELWGALMLQLKLKWSQIGGLVGFRQTDVTPSAEGPTEVLLVWSGNLGLICNGIAGYTGKFTPGCAGPPNAPPAPKLGMQAEQTMPGSTVASLSRRWPAWPAQQTPRPETRGACKAKTIIGGFELGCLGGAMGNVIGKENYVW
eukprot:246856-Pelagomonas_calceolata.AAC.1